MSKALRQENAFQSQESVCYQICVKGPLNPDWSDWFDDFSITSIDGDSLLTGKVLDQAALHGILAKIRDLGLTLVFIQALDSPKMPKPEDFFKDE